MRPILVVDDDAKIVELVAIYLRREGFEVVTAADGQAAVHEIRRSKPCLLVLDLMLPRLDGMSLLRLIRQESDVPVLVVSARGSTPDRVYGINEGADDYLAKPFSPAELVARVRSVLRRSRPHVRTQDADESVLRHLDLQIDLSRQLLLQSDREVSVTASEFHLLATLVAARGRILSRQQLLDALYGDARGGALERTIDVHIGRLRAKLDDGAARPRYIATVRGTGYRLATGTL
jgi:DNA-binding response OmpR family regulator